MKKFYKITGIVSGALFISGIILILIGVAAGGAKTQKILNLFNIDFGEEINKKEYTKIDEFNSIDIDADICDISIIPSEEYAIEYAVYSDSVNYNVNNKKLSISKNNKEYFGLNFNIGGFVKNNNDVYINIYVPKDTEYNEFIINNDCGSIKIEDLSIKNITIEADMGDVVLKNISAKDVSVNDNMGSVSYSGKVTGNIDIDNDMGNVDITGYLACNVDVSCDSGSADITTYYNSKCYSYDFEMDLGDNDIYNEGGEILEDVNYLINVEVDLGDAALTFTDAK